MRHLIILRHAKSSWSNPDVSDFDRPLNKRGKRSAKALGLWLKEKGMVPDAALVSSARRARETWDRLGFADLTPDVRRELYLAEPETLLDALQDSTAQTTLILAHNPGIAALSHDLVDTPPDHPRFDDFPTGAMLIVKFAGNGPIELGTGEVVSFVTPHDLTETE